MITAGDELGRTQQGNNNAYCQDSPISWVHWDTSEALAGPDRADPKLLKLRAEYRVFAGEVYRHGEPLLGRQGPSDRAQEHRLVRRAERRDDHRRLARRHPPDARPLSRRRRPRTGPPTRHF